MSDSNVDQQPGATDSGGAGYRPGNRVDPLPRQWQQARRQPAPAQPQAFAHVVLQPTAGGDWQPRPVRRTEVAGLLGLWLLVVLTAVAIALRFLDLSSVSISPAHLERGAAGAELPAQAARLAPYLSGIGSDSDDPFDDPMPMPMPATATPVAPTPAHAAVAEPSRAQPAARAPAVDEARVVQAPLRAAAPERAARAPASAAQPGACPEALRAMQLCPDQR